MSAALRHTHLVSLLGISLKPLCLIMEYLPFGTAYDAYTRLSKGLPKVSRDSDSSSEIDPSESAAYAFRNPRFRISVVRDTALGLNWMHSLTPPILHRDVRSPNILICSLNDEDAVVAKLSDFGTARVLVQSNAARDLGNPFWLAPEVSLSLFPSLALSFSFSLSLSFSPPTLTLLPTLPLSPPSLSLSLSLSHTHTLLPR